MNERPTPRTDAAATRLCEGFEQCVSADFARNLERERDEAREYAERCKQGCIKLSFAIDRIDYACGEPNEMEVSDYCVHQNEEAVVERVKKQLEAMREAIKEVHDALTELDQCRILYGDSMDIDNHTTDDCATARAKLQLFLKP